MIPHLLWILLWSGGEPSLSGYIDFEAYFSAQEIPYTAAALGGILQESEIDPAVIDEQIQKLGAGEFKDREAASLALGEIGEPAREALQAATRSRDPEIAQRATELLKSLPKRDEEQIKINRALALFALGQIQDPASRPLLEEFAAMPPSLEQRMANQALAAWDRKPAAQPPLLDDSRIWNAFPGDAAAVARYTPRPKEIEVKAFMRNSDRSQEQLIGLLLNLGELRFRRASVAVSADSLIKEVPDRAWVAAVLEGEFEPQQLGDWLTANGFAEKEAGGQKQYERAPYLIIPVNPNLLLTMMLRGEDLPQTETILAGLRGEESTNSLNAPLREQLPPAETEPPAWVRFVAPADFESERPWLKGVTRAELNAEKDGEGGFIFEASGWTADEATAQTVVTGVETLSKQRVGRIRNPDHPIMLPISQLWRNLESGQEAEKVWVKGEMPPAYFRSLHQQSERAKGQRAQPANRQIRIQQFQMRNNIQIQQLQMGNGMQIQVF